VASVRSVHGLFVLAAVRAWCWLRCVCVCMCAAASAVRAAACAVRCVRAAASVARAPFHRFRTFVPRRWETMVGNDSYHVVELRRRSGRPPRSPELRFIVFGRLYPGGGKQWVAPTPTLL